MSTQNKVVDFPQIKGIGGLPTGGGPPDNSGMEARVAKLESIADKTSERLASIDRDLATLKATNATKEDLHRELHTNTWRIIGTVLTFGSVITAVTYYIARNVH